MKVIVYHHFGIFLLVQIDDWHENRFVDNVIFALALDGSQIVISLDDYLLFCASLEQQFVDFVKIIVTFVYVDENLVFGEQKHLFQCRYTVPGFDAMARLEIQFFDVSQSHVGYFPLAVSSAVNRGIVHDNKLVVLGLMDVNFYHVHSHVNAVSVSLKRIFWCIAPISSMGYYQHIFGIGLIDFFGQFFGPGLCHASCYGAKQEKNG